MPESCGQLEVVAQFDPALVTVEGCSGGGEVEPGSQASATVEVFNDNPEPASVTVVVLVGGQEMASGNETVPAGGSIERTYQYTMDLEPGTYELEADVTNVAQA